MNIVFEGIDASGKTTIIRKLSAMLDKKGIKNQTIADIKEPTPLLPVFEKMFDSNFLELDEQFKTSIYQTLLFACSHFYVQEKNMNNSHITIYDRDIFTLFSYQKEFLKKEYPSDYQKFYEPFKKMMMFHNKKIDFIIYVSIPIEENIKRKINRDGLQFSEEERQNLYNFKKNIEAEIQSYVQEHPGTILICLDGREKPEVNCNKILEKMAPTFKNTKVDTTADYDDEHEI